MDRLDMAISLIQEAKSERENLKIYDKEHEKLPKWGDPGYWEAWSKFVRRFPRAPKKSVVNDNLKMARRILLGEYM